MNRRTWWLLALRSASVSILAYFLLLFFLFDAGAWFVGVIVQSLFPDIPARWLMYARHGFRIVAFFTLGLWFAPWVMAVDRAVRWTVARFRRDRREGADQ